MKLSERSEKIPRRPGKSRRDCLPAEVNQRERSLLDEIRLYFQCDIHPVPDYDDLAFQVRVELIRSGDTVPTKLIQIDMDNRAPLLALEVLGIGSSVLHSVLGSSEGSSVLPQHFGSDS